MRGNHSMRKENMERKVINAFQSNITYFEMLREHNLKKGLDDVNIETDVKSLMFNNLNRAVFDAVGVNALSVCRWQK